MQTEILLTQARGELREAVVTPSAFWAALVGVANVAPDSEHFSPFECRLFARAIRSGLERPAPRIQNRQFVVGICAGRDHAETLREASNQPLLTAVLALFDAGDGVRVGRIASRALSANVIRS